MKIFTFEKGTLEAINTFILSAPTKELADARLAIKVADDLDLALESHKEAEKTTGVEVTMADEKFMFLKKQIEKYGMDDTLRLYWIDKRAFIKIVDTLEDIAK